MRRLLLGAICATSFLASGYTGCGNLANDLNQDIKDKVEEEFQQSGTQCASLFEAKVSVGQLAVGCYSPEEIEARISKPTEEQVARCALELPKCSEADKQAILDATACLKELAQCEEAQLTAWEASVSDCQSILDAVTCSAPFTDSESDETPAP